MISSAEEWYKHFQPYQGKFTVRIKSQDTGLFGSEFHYITKNERLDFRLIHKALSGSEVVGRFSTYKTKVLGIDIDHHFIDAWHSERPCAELLKKYETVIKSIGQFPSLVFRSEHGLHLYYFFEYYSLHEIMQRQIEKKLGSASEYAEILPTPNHSLRIDPLNNCLDPRTLNRIPFPSEVELYCQSQVLSSDCLPDSFRRGKRKRLKSIRNQTKLETLEKGIIPIRAGSSNEAYKILSTAYYLNGLTTAEAVTRFTELLISSGYIGELRNLKRLEQRMKSTYRQLKRKGAEIFEGVNKPAELDLFDLNLIRSAVNKSPFAVQRKKALESYLQNLLRWKNYIDRMEKSEFELWSWFYMDFRVNRKAGFYPIPSLVMKSWNGHYKALNDFLQSLNMLRQETNHWFDLKGNKTGKCRYFSISTLYETKTVSDDSVFIEELQKSGLSQTAIAKILGVQKMTVSYWFSGKRSIPSNRLSEYVSLWGVNRSAQII